MHCLMGCSWKWRPHTSKLHTCRPIQEQELTMSIVWWWLCVAFTLIETTDKSETAVDSESNDETEIGHDRAHCYHYRIRYFRTVICFTLCWRLLPYTHVPHYQLPLQVTANLILLITQVLLARLPEQVMCIICPSVCWSHSETKRDGATPYGYYKMWIGNQGLWFRICHNIHTQKYAYSSAILSISTGRPAIIPSKWLWYLVKLMPH